MSVDFTNQSIEDLLPAVGRIVAFIRRRNHISRDQAEDFASFVKLKLVEREHAIRAGFRGRSTVETYLSVVVHRLFLDYRTSQWGKWRTSSVARRLGPEAIRLEDLIYRQGRSQAEAVRELISTSSSARTEAELEAIAASLPPRPRRVPSDESAAREPAAPATDDPVIAAEDRTSVDRIEAALDKALATLPPQDRLIVRLHFFEGLTIASVAEVLQLRQKPTYKRVEGILASLRVHLESAGVDLKTVTSLIGRSEFGVGLRKDFTMSVGKRTDDPSMES